MYMLYLTVFCHSPKQAYIYCKSISSQLNHLLISLPLVLKKNMTTTTESQLTQPQLSIYVFILSAFIWGLRPQFNFILIISNDQCSLCITNYLPFTQCDHHMLKHAEIIH